MFHVEQYYCTLYNDNIPVLQIANCKLFSHLYTFGDIYTYLCYEHILIVIEICLYILNKIVVFCLFLLCCTIYYSANRLSQLNNSILILFKGISQRLYNIFCNLELSCPFVSRQHGHEELLIILIIIFI